MLALSRFIVGPIVCVVAVLQLPSASVAEEKGPFSRTTIDLGIVVNQIGSSVKFYTEAIGFKETGGFSVSGEFAADAGLANGVPLDIRVLSLGDDASATKLKLMEVPGVKKRQSDNEFIHSQPGYRYLTIYVADVDAALARLKKAGVTPLGKTPMPLPAGLAAGMALIVVRDPDGNLIELVGPKS
jgi:lactoylglutathione lyase